MNAPRVRVALVFIAQRVNVYLRFGDPVRELIIDRERRVAEFAPLAVFCRIRWEANEYGTTLWQLSVLHASPAEKLSSIAGVHPGATLLLQVQGHRHVQQMLQLIQSIEEQRIAPADVAPSYWRTVHNRLVARSEIGRYTRARHTAYLKRRSLT